MSRIQQQVMASVLVIYYARRALSARALKAYAFAGAVATAAGLVSIQNVLANLMIVGLDGLGAFMYAAITNTTPAVQTSMLVAVVFAALLVRDVASSRRFA